MTKNVAYCPKCHHDIELHKVKILGGYDSIAVGCTAQHPNSYHDECLCNAGFKKIYIEEEDLDKLNEVLS